jgi:hypothetical protein
MKNITVLLSLLLFVACFPSSVRAQASTIALVQHASKDAGTATSATLAFNSNNIAGNWIGVCVRAGHSGQMFTVTDSRGNAYHKAVQFNVTVDTPNGHTLGIFYAENIAGGANAITVSDTTSGTIRFAIVEYSGVAATNSPDVIAMAQGNGVSPNSGNATTTSSGDLLLGAISTANSASFTAGNGFAIEGSVPASPNTKLIAEDRVQTAAGTVSAGAILGAPDSWGVILAAFKAGTAGGGSPPNITSLNPASGVVGTSVTISGANFGATQGTSTLTFNGTTATARSWSATSIVVPVPAGATTGSVVVTIGGAASNGMNFAVTPPPPGITSLNPTSGAVSTSVAIAGTNFGTTQGASTVTFNGMTATATSWGATGIVVPVPSGAATGNVVVTVGGVASNGMNFIVPSSPPSITSLNPTSGAVGTPVTIVGTNFGTTQGTGTVTFNGTAGTPTSWSATSIVVPVPSGAATGNVVITSALSSSGGSAGATSNGVNFTVTSSAPSITSLNPTSGAVGTSVTITGTNFGTTQGTNTVTFNGTAGTPTSWSATNIVVLVPSGTTTGDVVVTVGGVASNRVNFTVLSATVGIVLVQRASQDAGVTTSSSVAFNTANTAGNFITVCIRAGRSGQAFTVRDSNGNTYRQGVQFNVTADAPNGDTLGIFYAENINGGANTITVSDTILGTLRFSILEYSGIATANSLDVTATGQGTSLSPNSANAVTTWNGELLLSAILTANPASFTAGNGFAIERSIPAEPNTKLIAEDRIQTAAGTVSAGAFLGAPDSWGVALAAFKAGSAGGGTPPSITSLSPTSGVVGTSVTITGVNFGAAQGTSTVKFNGIAATPTSWSATSIVAPVPAGATTGNVVVTVGGVASNGVNFTVQTDTTPPVVTITAPANNASVSGTITLTATATDPDSAVSFVQFQVDGANVGAKLTSAPYSHSLDTTTLSNGAHTLTAVAQDPSANQATSAAVTITVSNATSSGMGPLVQSPTNSHWFVDKAGKGVMLSGSQTWNDAQDIGNAGAFTVIDFTAYVNFLVSHGNNATILWHKDLPTACNWAAGGTWITDSSTGFPWQRTGPGNASDGLPKFDLTKFNQAYFDRIRARAIQLQQAHLYAVVQMFDGLGLTHYRCAQDGYPLTGSNNVNGVDGGSGSASMTMNSPNAITGYQDAYVKKMVDTVNDLPNVLWEPQEEADANSGWWEDHMIGLLHTYEQGGTWEGTSYPGKTFQHPVLLAWYNNGDSVLYNSNADVIAPNAKFPAADTNCGSGTPACKVVVNDSDHSYFSMWTSSDQANRQFVWENFLNGNSVMFMDPYLIFAGPASGWANRNNCDGGVAPAHGVCTVPDSAKWDNLRNNMGYAVSYANKMDLVKMTPQGSLSSTGHCLAQTPSAGAEYLVYASSGGSFTVNLTAMPSSRALNVEWFDPSTGTTSPAGAVGAGTTRTFTPPFSGDAVLYLVDTAGHN